MAKWKKVRGVWKRVREPEWIVYTDRPPWQDKCRVGTIRIPAGKDFNDVRDRLPASMRKYATTFARTAREARSNVAQYGVRC